MAIKIGFATIEDLKDIKNLNLQLFKKEIKEYDPTLNLAWHDSKRSVRYFTKSIKDDTACTLVAKLDGKIVGYLIGWIKKRKNYCRTIEKQAELENMIVLEAFRSKKIGTKLVKRFFDWASRKGVTNIAVAACAQNKKAIKFYRNCGFKDHAHKMEIIL